MATGVYDDADLRRLRTPAQDAAALAGVLANPTIGDFDVLQVVDQPRDVVAAAVDDFFAGGLLDDLLLVHLSCHGLEDDDGRLHFAATDTRRGRLASTALPAALLADRMQRCRARSTVLLLDCCYSGAFAAGFEGDERVRVREMLAGPGRAVLTASDTVEYAWEGDDVTGRPETSLFTPAIVEGLETGGADRDGDGVVSVDDLYAHVCERVRDRGRAQTPQLWARGVAEPLVIARNPHAALAGPPAAAPPADPDAVGETVPASGVPSAGGTVPASGVPSAGGTVPASGVPSAGGTVPASGVLSAGGTASIAGAGVGVAADPAVEGAPGGADGGDPRGPARVAAATHVARRSERRTVVGVRTSLGGGHPPVRRRAPLPLLLAVVMAVLAVVLVTLARDGDDGGGTAGSRTGGTRFARPVGIAVGADGRVYVAESAHGTSRVTVVGGDTGDRGGTVAGGDGGDGDGIPASDASLAAPHGIAVSGGRLYIADRDHARVRLVSADGTIGTVAGTGRVGPLGDLGPATGARLWEPTAVALDVGGSLFIADRAGHRVRRVDSGGTITTVAGSGTPGFAGDGGAAVEARLASPSGVAVGPDGALYIADSDNDRIRRVDAAGFISTVAGSGVPGFGGDGGPAIAAALASPAAVAVGPDGALYVADTGNNRIRRVGADGTIATVAGDGRARSGGDGGPAAQASLNGPAGLCVTAGGDLYLADTGNGLVRKVDASGIITSL